MAYPISPYWSAWTSLGQVSCWWENKIIRHVLLKIIPSFGLSPQCGDIPFANFPWRQAASRRCLSGVASVGVTVPILLSVLRYEVHGSILHIRGRGGVDSRLVRAGLVCHPRHLPSPFV